ncbi:MAG: FtsX-like permease family protein [Gammaproteobacteria bacterium]|nr:FtsX-like permease family protein [Gammaproteobacteria bacterium]
MNFEPPIAWLQLRAQKPQTLFAILTIAFITVMLFMQIGSRSAFLEALLEMPRKLKGDLFLVNASNVTILRPLGFSQRRLYQVPAFEEVESVMPLYLRGTQIPDPTGKPGFLTRILVVGFQIDHNPFDSDGIDDKLHLLGEGGVILIDELSRPKFRPIIREVVERGHTNITIQSAIGQVRASIKGLFSIGANDVNYSHFLTSDETFMDIFGTHRQNIHVGVIHLKPGTDPVRLQKELAGILPSDVVVMQKHEVLAKEKNLFEFHTPLGVLFRIAMLVSILVGIMVVYQILFQITSKHLRDYSTLKALGFSHAMLMSIVLTKAMILAIPGYFLGLAVSFHLYEWMTKMIAIQFTMKPSTEISVFALVTLISLVSALLAIRKLREADPADLFG